MRVGEMLEASKIIESRSKLQFNSNPIKQEEEGGCGVIGLACSIPVKGKYIKKALLQMHNRGNGKGGGIAAMGLNPTQLDVSKEILENNYLIQIAYLDPSSRRDIEEEFIYQNLEVEKAQEVYSLEDHKQIELEIKPPVVWRYFCRVKTKALDRFIEENKLSQLSQQKAENEFIYQNSFNLNRKFYYSNKKAFVLSHGKNLLIFKIVGYAEQAMKYYQLEEIEAHVWIGHQRYPTRGKLWHPGGAHPFTGLNVALVHNGDFANYHAICEYLRQRNIYPLFLTDTEVAALLFDLYTRVYDYPLEYVIEALAPTTERDFELLPAEKKKIYKAIQASHIHASPDGPWFFIIARNHCEVKELELIGITDTSMLRPQVFALQEGEVKIGLIASEKQAIDAVLRSLSIDDRRFKPYADKYWNARGGSHTDGGAFIFKLQNGNLICTDKFGNFISTAEHNRVNRSQILRINPDMEKAASIQMLTQQLDRRGRKRGDLLAELEKALYSIFRSASQPSYCFTTYETQELIPKCREYSQTLIIDASGFPSEGDNSLSRFIVKAYNLGWKKFIIFNLEGQRFIGCGLGNSNGVRIDVYGSSGDYLGSGVDGAEIYVHGDAQDQVAQIFKSGKLVIYGNVGQAFMYGAKGGEVYVLGNTAGRPLINAVGKPRAVINGTCLDYLAESFMAGDPHNGGGFVILNGLEFNSEGEMIELETPYPGGNLFSLPSGGAIFIRDPHCKVGEDQLNGGRFVPFTERDWELILPYLKENERLFEIKIEELLTVNGRKMSPKKIYRKIEPASIPALAPTGD
jgi:glutamate synthase domain-containing protein 1/glutamate synthase domain-containing protein 3